MSRKEKINLSVAIIIYAAVVSWMIGRDIIIPQDSIDTTILFVLALATIFYAVRTSDIANATIEQAKATKEQAEATRQQADASVKMAEVASRPYIVQRAVYKSTTSGSPPDFDYFEIYNVGNGPAIEVEISAFDKEKTHRNSVKRSFFGGSESIKIIEFRLEWDLTTYAGSTCYLVSEYQSIYSYGSQKWYQTWLPFRIARIHGTDKIILSPGDLEFREISEKERIDAFGSRSYRNDS